LRRSIECGGVWVSLECSIRRQSRRPTSWQIADAAVEQVRVFQAERERRLRAFAGMAGSSFNASRFRAFERALQWRDQSHCRG
jgi:hypothetical protein